MRNAIPASALVRIEGVTRDAQAWAALRYDGGTVAIWLGAIGWLLAWWFLWRWFGERRQPTVVPESAP